MPERHYHHHHHHWRDREGYAYRAGRPGPGPNFHQLRRIPSRGKLAGVCAGFAEYFDWNLKWVRLGAVALTVLMFPFPIIGYILLAVFMKPDTAGPIMERRSEEEEKFWRTFSTRPQATFSELKHRFRALDARLAEIERTVTSDEFGLRKAFRDLERGA